MVSENDDNNEEKKGVIDEGRREDPSQKSFESSFVRMVENHDLVGGICAIVSLFLLNPLIGLLGVFFATLAFTKIRQFEDDDRISDEALIRAKRITIAVIAASLVVVVADLAITQLLADVVARYAEITGGSFLSASNDLDSATSTWG